jgi:hypothetical protein
MQTYNITAIQGSNIMLRVTATDSNGTALNLNGFSTRGYVKSKYSDSGILLNLSPFIYSATSGLVDITISGNYTAGLPCGMFPYDIECFVSGSGSSGNESVVKFLRGYVEILPETTY